MNQTLVDAIVKLTGQTEEEIQDKLADISIDDLYKLMDLVRKGEKASIVAFIDPIQESNPNRTSKNMADNKKITGKLPKPRDPMAKALALPQYQAKTEPSKKGQLDKALRKHKGRDMHEAIEVDTEADLVEEGVMGMTQMDSMLPRLLTLAGCAPMDDETVTLAANEPEVEIVPEIEPEVIDTPALDSSWDKEDDVVARVATTNIQTVRDSFDAIRTNLPEIKVSEFAEVRQMVADLMSQIDRMGNHISGK